jgi:hypothetical protein
MKDPDHDIVFFVPNQYDEEMLWFRQSEFHVEDQIGYRRLPQKAAGGKGDLTENSPLGPASGVSL